MREFVYKGGSGNSAVSTFYTINDAVKEMAEMILPKKPSLRMRRAVGAIAGTRAEDAPEEAWSWMHSFGETVSRDGLVFFFLGLARGDCYGEMKHFLSQVSDCGMNELFRDLQWLVEWVGKDSEVASEWLETRKLSSEQEWDVDIILGGQNKKKARELLKKWGHQSPYLAMGIADQMSRQLGHRTALEWVWENVTEEMLECGDIRGSIISDWVDADPVSAKAWEEGLPDTDKWKTFALNSYIDNVALREEWKNMNQEQ